MYQAPTMTPGKARETIDRLSEETASVRRHSAASEAMITDYNDSLSAFVPRDKMPLFYIGKDRYVGDISRPRRVCSKWSLPPARGDRPNGLRHAVARAAAASTDALTSGPGSLTE